MHPRSRAPVERSSTALCHVLRLGREHLARGEAAGAVPYMTAGFDLAIEARAGEGPLALFGLDTGTQGAYVVASNYGEAATARRS